MFQVNKITKTIGAQIILDEVSFVINPTDRVGLVGPNGCGKSTLLRIIVGQVQPDSGQFSHGPNLNVGYLPQGMVATEGRNVAEEVRSGIKGLEQARKQVERMAAQLDVSEGNAQKALLDAYGEALTRFEHLGGYTVEHRIDEILTGLGLANLDPSTPLIHLSGGQQTRVGLARLLISQPNLLLLDEPTNHLDIESLEWLETFLTRYDGAALIVSHDRTFLDNTVMRILEIDDDTHQIREFQGNYSAYESIKGMELKKQWATWKDEQAEIRRLKTDVRRTRQQALSTEHKTIDSSARRLAAKVAKKAKARERRLYRYIESKDRLEKPKQSWRLKLEFIDTLRSGQIVARFNQIGHGFNQSWLFQDLNLTLQHGERVALIGANGSGKTTLLRILVGDFQPKMGKVHLGAKVRLGYMPQKQKTLDPQSTPLSIIQGVASMSETDTRNFLHYFLFSSDEVFTPVGKLSFGERARLLLAKHVIGGANFLVLDEPINHLDIPSRDNFQTALEAFPGTVLAAVHDRTFIHQFATQIWSLENQGIKVTYHD
jgi:ATP-binding cassette subfamily F protein 3